jgi:hypothetical protein
VRRGLLLLGSTVAVLITLAGSASASNATLRATLDTWSKRIGADARAVALAAQQRHPRRMTTSANRFHHDSILAHDAAAAQKPSTANGNRARRLALTAFNDYALAGSKWAASGRARLAHQTAAAIADAKTATNYANAGNKRLLTADALLR